MFRLSLSFADFLKEVKDCRKGIKGDEGDTRTKGFLSTKKIATQAAFLHERGRRKKRKRECKKKRGRGEAGAEERRELL